MFRWVFFLIFSLLSAYSYDSPVHNPTVVSFFGDTRGDHFHSGLDYRGENLSLYPITDMKVLFYCDEAEDPTQLPMGYGNFMVLQDNNDMQAHYVHLSQIVLKDKIDVTPSDIIAFSGNTGHSFGGHLHFTIFDLKSASLLSASSIIPLETIDDKPPHIHSLFTILKNKVYSFNEKGSLLMYSGEMELFIIIEDPYEFDRLGKRVSYPVSVAQIKMSVDGELKKNYDFSLLKENPEKHQLALKTGETVREIYGNKFNYKLGKFTPTLSRHTFLIQTRDWSGNESEKSFIVSFR